MTFFKKIEAWFKKVFTGLPSTEKLISATLTVVAPLLETILALTGNEAAAALVAEIVGKIQSDMAVVAVVVQDGTATPTLAGVILDIKTNLAALLTAGQIKDPVTLQKVTAIVNTVLAEIEAVGTALGFSATPATA